MSWDTIKAVARANGDPEILIRMLETISGQLEPYVSGSEQVVMVHKMGASCAAWTTSG